MKKITISLAAIAALIAISCNKEQTPTDLVPGGENFVEKTFYASYDAETKVGVGTIADGKVNLLWQNNDAIHVLSVNQAELPLPAVISTEDGTSATVTASVTPDAGTYYAVYPASAVETTNTWVTATVGEVEKTGLRVTIPAEQQAYHNTFDPKAYVATAVTANNQLVFKPCISAIKFQLGDNAADVEKVVFQINNSTNAAGTGVLYTDAFTTHAWLDGTTCVAYSKVTLTKPDDGFKPSTDYYITFRANKCDQGITLYIAFKDGTVKKVTSSKQLFNETVLGAVKSFGDIVTPAKTLSAKDAYDLGFDIMVGDVVLNKATIDSNDAVANGLKDGVVNFVDGKITLSTTVGFSKNTYVVGDITNNTDAMDSLIFNAKNIYHKAGTLGFKDVAINGSANTNYLISNTAATVNSDKFILDGCRVKTAKPVYYLAIDGYTCKNLYVVDTDIELTAAANVFDFSKCATEINSIEVKNSIVYDESNVVSRFVNAVSIKDVVLENNTLFNLHAGVNYGLIHCTGTISSLSLNNNLFSFYTLNGSTEKIIAGTVSSYSGPNNAFHKRGSDSNSMILYGEIPVTWAESAICGTKYPYASNVAGAGATR